MAYAQFLAAQPERRFGPGDVERGSFAKYLDGGSAGAAGAAFDMAGGTVAVPDSGNAERSKALGKQASAFLDGYMKTGIGDVMNTQNTAMQTGFQGLTATQEVKQAEELAALQAQGAQQEGMFDAIGGGLSILGGFGSKFGWFGKKASG